MLLPVVGLCIHLSSNKNVWNQKDLSLNTRCAPYSVTPYTYTLPLTLWAKKYINFGNYFLALIGWRERNTNITVLLEFNLIAYIKYQMHTKLLFMLALSTHFSLACLTIFSLKERITVNNKWVDNIHDLVSKSNPKTKTLSCHCSFVCFPRVCTLLLTPRFLWAYFLWLPFLTSVFFSIKKKMIPTIFGNSACSTSIC